MDTLPDERADKPERAEEKPESPAPPPKKPRGRRALVVLFVTTLALGVGVVLGYRPFCIWYLKREAKARGVEVSFDDFDLSVSRVILSGPRVTLEGVEGVVISADEMTIALVDQEPTRVDGRGMVITIDGQLSDRLAAVSVWVDKHEEMVALAVSTDVLLSAQDPVALSLSGRVATERLGGGTFVGDVVFAGINLGEMGARWVKKGSIVVGLGARSAEEIDAAKVLLELDPTSRPMKATM